MLTLIVLIHLRLHGQLYLLEVTKAAIKKINGEITVAHTTADIDKFSITSMYEVGIDLGLIDCENDMVYYLLFNVRKLIFGISPSHHHH